MRGESRAMSSLDPTRPAVGKGKKRSGTPTGGKGGGKKGKSKDELRIFADEMSAQSSAPFSSIVRLCIAGVSPSVGHVWPLSRGGQGRGHHTGKRVGAVVTSPARGSDHGSSLRRGGRSRGHLPGQGVGAWITSPATGSERGLPPRRGRRGDPDRDFVSGPSTLVVVNVSMSRVAARLLIIPLYVVVLRCIIIVCPKA